MKIAFLGLGAMGLPMAQNLVAAGHEVTVYNRSPARAEPLRDQARIASSPAEAVRDAEVAVTMLADDAAVEAVALGEGGLVAALAPGALHVSSSTISVALAERLARAHAAAGQGLVSAPVFGRPEAAAGKQLWIVAAGAPEHVARCLPVLSALGRGVSQLGDAPSAANVVKLAGNFLIAAMLETLGEAFALTRKAGVAPDAFLDLFVNVFARSPIFEGYARRIASEGYEPAGFPVLLGLKDVRFALSAAESLTVPMPVASLLRDHLLAAVAQGRGELDWSALARFAAERAGLP